MEVRRIYGPRKQCSEHAAYVIEGQGAVLPSEPLPSPGNLAPPTKTTY